MKIVIETGLPRNCQAGDWEEKPDGTIHILVTEMNLKSEVAVAIHELIEFILCKETGITDLEVTQFDALFESERMVGKHAVEAEAGDDSRSPYKTQHERATFGERAVCAALELPWAEHERTVLGSLV